MSDDYNFPTCVEVADAIREHEHRRDYKIVPGSLVKYATTAAYAIPRHADLIGLILSIHELSDEAAEVMGYPAYVDVLWSDGQTYVTMINDIVLITRYTQFS